MIRRIATTLAFTAALSMLAACHAVSETDDAGTMVSDGGGTATDGHATTDGASTGDSATSMIPGHDEVGLDRSHKEEPRMMPAESYVRSYMLLFGGLAPLAIQDEFRLGTRDLFDTWGDYLQVIGLPDHRTDIGRNGQSSALMLAAFERLGVALCDRSVIHDLRGAIPVTDRHVFAFETPSGTMTAAAFAELFDTLHVTFLGYPSSMAPPGRVNEFYALYMRVAARHTAARTLPAFNATEAAWAAVCYGLVRHPEFHLY